MFAIHINLNYELYSKDECLEIWDCIRSAMQEAGFHLRGRRFFINQPPAHAIKLAKQAIDSLEPHYDFDNKRVYRFIKEFFGYQVETVANILTPTSNALEINEMGDEDLNYSVVSLL
jgi:hypothetical protein